MTAVKCERDRYIFDPIDKYFQFSIKWSPNIQRYRVIICIDFGNTRSFSGEFHNNFVAQHFWFFIKLIFFLFLRRPQISDPDCDELRNILEQISSTAKDTSSSSLLPSNSHLKFGLSSLIRNVKNSNVGYVLVSSNLKPHFIIKQIINLCTATSTSSSSSIRVLIVPNLEYCILKLYGFTTFGVTFEKCNELVTLVDWVTMKSEQFPIRGRTELAPTFGNLFDKMEIDEDKQRATAVDEDVDLDNILLKRNPDGSRAFVLGQHFKQNSVIANRESVSSEDDDEEASVDDQSKKEFVCPINIFQETGVKRKLNKKARKRKNEATGGVLYLKPNVCKTMKNVNRPKKDKKKNKRKNLLKKH